MAALPEKCPNLTMFGGHVSHSYINGTNIYFVYNLKIQDSENATAEHYQVMEGVCDEVLNMRREPSRTTMESGKYVSARLRKSLAVPSRS